MGLPDCLNEVQVYHHIVNVIKRHVLSWLLITSYIRNKAPVMIM